MNGNEQDTRVIICDDEQDIRDTLQEYLCLRGFEVRCARDGKELREIVDLFDPHVVLLDINMPGEDGLSLARFLSARGGTAIMMLTAAADVVDRVVGLEMGADDYLSKPVDLRELQARIKAVLRRGRRAAAGSETRDSGELVQFGRCKLDLASHNLIGENGEAIGITAMEFSLLKVFAQNAGRVLNRDQLLEQAHDRDWDPYDRSIDIRISRLRKKIELNPSKPTVIKTVRGIGYVFHPAGS